MQIRTVLVWNRLFQVKSDYTNDATQYLSEITGDFTASASGTYYNLALYGSMEKIVNGGVTDSGYGVGCRFSAFAKGAGTLSELTSLWLSYGHETGASGTTTNAYGIKINPYCQGSGTITNSYGIKLDTSAGVTPDVTNFYGLYISDYSVHAANNYVAILTNSGDVIFNEASTNADFRVEAGENTHMLFVDASVDAVGIGTNAPEHTLHVNGAINLDPIATPSAPSSGFVIYCDSSDQDLKAMDPDGVTTVLATWSP